MLQDPIQNWTSFFCKRLFLSFSPQAVSNLSFFLFHSKRSFVCPSVSCKHFFSFTRAWHCWIQSNLNVNGIILGNSSSHENSRDIFRCYKRLLKGSYTKSILFSNFCTYCCAWKLFVWGCKKKHADLKMVWHFSILSRTEKLQF